MKQNLPIAELRDQRNHRYAALYRIQRKDGVVLRLSTANTVIEFEKELYQPMASIQGSIRRREGGLGQSNTAVRGNINSDSITDVDIRRGKYRGAEIVEYVVDWMYPMAGYLSAQRYWLKDFTYDGTEWQADVEGIANQLRLEVGRKASKRCGYDFGDSLTCRAGVPGRSLWYVDVAEVTDNYKIRLNNSAPSWGHILGTPGYDNDWFKFGKLLFRTGEGQGTETVCINWNATTYFATLVQEPPFTINVGDRIDLEVGCNRLATTCKTKFNNLDNFGAYRFVPGTDKLLTNPAF